MTIEDDIRAWALERPGWQQDVLVALARGEKFEPERISELTGRLLEPGRGEPSEAASDIVLGRTESKQVRLSRLHNLKGVNALADDQELPFAPDGLTIIYGNNGSGKSGYARLVKGMVSARHSSTVLPDVFKDNGLEPSAEIAYQVDGAEASEKFPLVAPIEDLQQVRFYDEHCGDEYLARESTITYRPSALVLFDGLIAVCDEVRAELQVRIRKSEQKTLELALPPGTAAGIFLTNLSRSTTDAEIKQATTLRSTAKEDRAEALKEVARLEASNAVEERARLQSGAARARQLQTRLTQLTDAVTTDRLQDVRELKGNAVVKRQAAAVAATNTFEGEPLEGVGSGAWRELWQTAQMYAVTGPYHGHEFPEVGEGARCVLCQQHLGSDAKDRFSRFHSFMTDTTELEAKDAERSYDTALSGLRALDFATQQTTSALAVVRVHDLPLARSTLARLGALEARRDKALTHFEQDEPAVSPLPPSEDANKLGALAASLDLKATETDVEGFKRDLIAARKKYNELKAASALSASVDKLKAEVVRLKELRDLEDAKQHVDTKGITRKATGLTTRYASAQILDNFTRETERMNLKRVTLSGRGGSKGKFKQIPDLLNTSHKDAKTPAVLSEGEQTVLGLAGFFTEAEFDESNSALILDDPVTSLDHVRRDKVAERLIEFAQKRQVVIFTHDIAFVADLLNAAPTHVTVTTRSIKHRGDVPGYSTEGFPWKTQAVGQRMDTILTEVQRLKKDELNLDEDEYEKRVHELAGMLSETWERLVSSEIVNQVYDRSRSQVRPEMVRMLVKITDEDNKDYQEGYGKTSKWALRHDKAEETNYVPPRPHQLEAEYARLKAWHKRIKSYQNKPPS